MNYSLFFHLIVAMAVFYWIVLPFVQWVRYIYVLRKALSVYRTESRKTAMNRVGEWRDD